MPYTARMMAMGTVTESHVYLVSSIKCYLKLLLLKLILKDLLRGERRQAVMKGTEDSLHQMCSQKH